MASVPELTGHRRWRRVTLPFAGRAAALVGARSTTPWVDRVEGETVTGSLGMLGHLADRFAVPAIPWASVDGSGAMDQGSAGEVELDGGGRDRPTPRVLRPGGRASPPVPALNSNHSPARPSRSRQAIGGRGNERAGDQAGRVTAAALRRVSTGAVGSSAIRPSPTGSRVSRTPTTSAAGTSRDARPEPAGHAVLDPGADSDAGFGSDPGSSPAPGGDGSPARAARPTASPSSVSGPATRPRPLEPDGSRPNGRSHLGSSDVASATASPVSFEGPKTARPRRSNAATAPIESAGPTPPGGPLGELVNRWSRSPIDSSAPSPSPQLSDATGDGARIDRPEPVASSSATIVSPLPGLEGDATSPDTIALFERLLEETMRREAERNDLDWGLT